MNRLATYPIAMHEEMATNPWKNALVLVYDCTQPVTPMLATAPIITPAAVAEEEILAGVLFSPGAPPADAEVDGKVESDDEIIQRTKPAGRHGIRRQKWFPPFNSVAFSVK